MSPAEPTALTQDSETPASLRRWLRAPWDYFAMAVGLAYWAVLGLLVTGLSSVLCLILPENLGRSVGQAFHHWLFRLFVVLLRVLRLVDSDLTSLGGLRDIHAPIIVAPNHTSLWDVVFLIARMPHALCVMKKSILHNPFLGGGARLCGYIPNGGNTQMIRDAADSLHSRAQLLIFPEGTRTRRDARWTNPFKGGVAIIAARANVPVYPVFIRSNTRFLEKGWPLWKRPNFPIRISFELGEPVTPGPDESSQEFTARLQTIYERELAKPHPLRRTFVTEQIPLAN